MKVKIHKSVLFTFVTGCFCVHIYVKTGEVNSIVLELCWVLKQLSFAVFG